MKHLFSALTVVMLLTSSMISNAQSSAADGVQSPAASAAVPQADGDSATSNPNILFIVMDDVGIDQMKIFGYGGLTAPKMPNVNAVARAGVRFRNTWSMPECSPSRAMFFEGRYPLRTKIYAAILNDDLANSQMSPFEVSTPNLLRRRGYDSALFGKFHLAGPTFNPFGEGTPLALGWDHFDGFLEGAPHPIDTTAGGVAAAGTYTCGFVPNANFAGGSNAGACYTVDNKCAVIVESPTVSTPGKTCLENGGIFVPNQACQSTRPAGLQFSNYNAYYVSSRIIEDRPNHVTDLPLTDPRTRGYVSAATTNSAIQWINSERAKGRRWMATVAFANNHTPYQQPPDSLLPQGSEITNGLQCTGNDPRNVVATRVLSNQMITAMDTEIGQILVGTGLATANSDGSLNYHPDATNTMVVIIGDNGTFAPVVKEPFDLNRAKGFVYQTGVWVPLIVAGPLVNSPDREVKSMVNVADLFQLFGEIGGIDVHQAVPKSHILDSISMLPYLTNPDQASIRQTNFTQTGNNIHVNDQPPPPCVVPLTTPPTCIQIIPQKGVCEAQGGIWYGPNPTPPATQLSSCCAVKNSGLYDSTGLNILPVSQTATRNDDFKLVQKVVTDCSSSSGSDITVNEFYKVNEAAPIPKIDKVDDDLCSSTGGCPAGLNENQLKNYNELMSVMQSTLTSEPDCPGDGNEDKQVNVADLLNWAAFSYFQNPENPGYSSSWYDFTYDGLTNEKDLDIIRANYGKNCLNKN